MAAIMAVAGAGEVEVFWRAMIAVVNNANTSKTSFTSDYC